MKRKQMIIKVDGENGKIWIFKKIFKFKIVVNPCEKCYAKTIIKENNSYAGCCYSKELAKLCSSLDSENYVVTLINEKEKYCND